MAWRRKRGDRSEILWDDRDESPGVKFTDAELLGMPWILTVSPRSLAAGGIEVTERATGERSTRPIEEVERLLVEGFEDREAVA
jgi:prolyl-tRNA synthetase